MGKHAGAFKSEKRKKELMRQKKQEEKRQKRQSQGQSQGQNQKTGHEQEPGATDPEGTPPETTE